MIKHLYKINDFTDINKMKEDKSFKDSKVKVQISDKKKRKPILNKEYNNLVYMLATTSDKEINSRTYADKSTKELVVSGGWTSPYNKPVLKNHDQIEGEPQGRILDAWYVTHDGLSVESAHDSVLPEEVLKFFQDNGCFEEGTGSTILKAFVDNETMKKIEDGFYLTVSQGIFVEDMRCNICGSSIWECSHSVGREYELEDKTKKVCIPVASGQYEAGEISIVNVPANDTSIIYIPDKKENKTNDAKIDKTQITDSNTIVPKIDNNENVLDNTQNDNENKGDEMIKDLLIASLLKDMKNTWNFEDSAEAEIKDFISSLEDEKIEKLMKVLDSLKTSTHNLVKEVSDSLQTIATQTEPIKDSEQKPEEPKTEPETEPENTNVEDNKENAVQTNDGKEEPKEGSAEMVEKNIKDDLEALKEMLKAKDAQAKTENKDSLSELFIKNFN